MTILNLNSLRSELETVYAKMRAETTLESDLQNGMLIITRVTTKSPTGIWKRAQQLEMSRRKWRWHCNDQWDQRFVLCKLIISFLTKETFYLIGYCNEVFIFICTFLIAVPFLVACAPAFFMIFSQISELKCSKIARDQLFLRSISFFVT